MIGPIQAPNNNFFFFFKDLVSLSEREIEREIERGISQAGGVAGREKVAGPG